MKVHFELLNISVKDGRLELGLKVQPYINGKVITRRARSGIYINNKFFDPNLGVKDLGRFGNSPEVEEHRQIKEELNKIATFIEGKISRQDKSSLTKDWLRDVLVEYRYYTQRAEEEKMKSKRSFVDLTEEYLSKKTFSSYHILNFKVMVRAVLRFEGYVRKTDRHRKDFTFDINTVTRDDIEEFRYFLLHEKELSDKNPRLFAALLKEYPASLMSIRNKIMGRGNNATIKLMKKLKAFFTWCYENEKTTNRPFDGIKIGTEKAGEPIYINLDERNAIANLKFEDKYYSADGTSDENTESKDDKEKKMSAKYLETQRDIFIFQCLTGCRVGDMMKLTHHNITFDNVLTYVPHKTKNEGEQAFAARVPLVPKAIELIKKYKGVDGQGRLFPFISQQRYNDAIKVIFRLAGLTYQVKVFNALTEEFEFHPLNEVASSHMARKTFIGNLYKKVQDPNLIGQMSGHVDGSRAFKRYRKIEDDTLRDTVKLIE